MSKAAVFQDSMFAASAYLIGVSHQRAIVVLSFIAA
jgi:hypothetical protein